MTAQPIAPVIPSPGRVAGAPRVRAAAVCPLPMIRARANTERGIIMRTLAALLVLSGHCFVSHTAAAQSQDCKLCREDYTACVKAHTQGACKTNYDICMNHCRKK